MVVTFRIPQQYWVLDFNQPYGLLRNSSEFFDEELRLWIGEHGGVLRWTSARAEASIRVNGTERVFHEYYDTWEVTFHSDQSALMFKMTWL